MKLAVRILPLLLLAAAATLYVPGPAQLDLYDVRDLVYDLPDFPSVDISLANGDQQCYFEMIGMDFADMLGWLVPGGDGSAERRGVAFSNGLVIARATRAQHAAIWTAIALWRIRTRSLEHLDRAFHRAQHVLQWPQSAAR